ncbi:MAG: hypothetical protein WBF49_14885, partial [Methyloceanibacter sp.]
MEGLGVLLVVVAAFVASLPALREQWRTDRAGSIKTIWLFGLYTPMSGSASSWCCCSRYREPPALSVGISLPLPRMFAECSCRSRATWL